jgi:hypothetical protein
MTEKQSLDAWKEHVKLILSATTVDIDETTTEQDARKARLEANPEAWFKYYFPKYAYAEPAPFHIAATLRVLTRPEHYEVRMWSRELAKSTRTMMEVLYLVLVGHNAASPNPLKKKYVLVVSNSLENATRLLMPYKANLEHNQRILQDYGLQKQAGKWQAAEFTTEGSISFRAIGAGQSPRGTRNEEARPDIILFDDIDTDADCLNPETINKKWKWIEDADGRSAWPQKNSEADIDRVLAQKSYAAAQKEYFNNPVVEGAVFKEMAWRAVLPLHQYQALVCYTDPSYTATGDYKATVLVGAAQGQYHIVKCYLEQTTTATMVQWHFDLLQYLQGVRCRFYMEKVLMQDVLLKEVQDGMKQRGLYFSLCGDGRKKPDKYTRIEALLEPLNRNGLLYLNEAERNNPQMLRLEGQFKALAPGSSAHDDGPDAVEGAIWILQSMVQQMAATRIETGKQLRQTHF